MIAIDEIYKIYTLVHLWNPIWKPRKALLRSVIRAKNIAPAKKQSDRSGARRKEIKKCKIHSALFVRGRIAQTQK